MSNTFSIQSFLKSEDNELLVIDIPLGDASAPPANEVLDVFSPNQGKNQIWEATEDSAHPGYFFIRSLQIDKRGDSLVIDIQGVNEAKAKNMASGTPIDAYTQDQGWHENQLWTVALDPASTPNLNTALQPSGKQDFIFIQSYLTDSSGTPFVIDIQGWSAATKLVRGVAKLDAYPQKRTGTDNQRWTLIPIDWEPLAPKITSFTPDFNLSVPAKSYMTVSGTGFAPGLTLVFTNRLDQGDGTFSTADPILGVTDFAGNFSRTASFVDWGLGIAEGNGLGTQSGKFTVGVANNSGDRIPTVLASASAQWSGSTFSDFSNG
jgi:hypothetical protein